MVVRRSAYIQDGSKDPTMMFWELDPQEYMAPMQQRYLNNMCPKQSPQQKLRRDSVNPKP